MRTYDHPHPDARHVMAAYRRYILGFKKNKSKRAARALIHYRGIIETYLAAKEKVLWESGWMTIEQMFTHAIQCLGAPVPNGQGAMYVGKIHGPYYYDEFQRLMRPLARAQGRHYNSDIESATWAQFKRWVERHDTR